MRDLGGGGEGGEKGGVCVYGKWNAGGEERRVVFINLVLYYVRVEIQEPIKLDGFPPYK